MEPGQPKFKKYLIHESILTGRVIETNIRWSVYNDKNCRIFRFEYTLFALYIIPVYNKQKEDTNYNPAPSHPHPPPTPIPTPTPQKKINTKTMIWMASTKIKTYITTTIGTYENSNSKQYILFPQCEHFYHKVPYMEYCERNITRTTIFHFRIMNQSNINCPRSI